MWRADAADAAIFKEVKDDGTETNLEKVFVKVYTWKDILPHQWELNGTGYILYISNLELL